jgi:hypothetical protein
VLSNGSKSYQSLSTINRQEIFAHPGQDGESFDSGRIVLSLTVRLNHEAVLVGLSFVLQ